MQSNYVVTETMANFQWTGREIEKQLKNPASPLFIELQNAELFEKMDKDALKKTEAKTMYIKAHARQIEDDEREQELEKKHDAEMAKSRESLEQYYVAQNKATASMAGLSLDPVKKAAFYTALSVLVESNKKLVAVEQELYTLYQERESFSEKYAENRKSMADAVVAALDSIVESKVDTSTFSEEKKQELAEEKAKIHKKQAELSVPSEQDMSAPPEFGRTPVRILFMLQMMQVNYLRRACADEPSREVHVHEIKQMSRSVSTHASVKARETEREALVLGYNKNTVRIAEALHARRAARQAVAAAVNNIPPEGASLVIHLGKLCQPEAQEVAHSLRGHSV